jgi:hypothetical protein
MKKSFINLIIATAIAASFNLQAKDVEVKITKEQSYSTVHDGDELIKISRIQDTSHVIDGSFAKTSRPCPPFCINPISYLLLCDIYRAKTKSNHYNSDE